MGRLDLPDKVRDEDRAFWTEDKLEPHVGYMVVEDDGSITPMAGQSISPLPGDISPCHDHRSCLMERVAIIGSRKGADLAHVVRLVEALRTSQPDTIVVSGGAAGVDQMAESTWFRLGGRVRSYRPAPLDDGFGVEIWSYGGSEPALVLPPQEHRVQLASYTDACFYRDWLIAEDCDRLCAFYRAGGSSGTAFTEAMARDRKVDVHVFMPRREAA